MKKLFLLPILLFLLISCYSTTTYEEDYTLAPGETYKLTFKMTVNDSDAIISFSTGDSHKKLRYDIYHEDTYSHSLSYGAYESHTYKCYNDGKYTVILFNPNPESVNVEINVETGYAF